MKKPAPRRRRRRSPTPARLDLTHWQQTGALVGALVAALLGGAGIIQTTASTQTAELTRQLDEVRHQLGRVEARLSAIEAKQQ